MNQVAAVDPAAFYAVWERVKAEARQELASGHRAASAVDVAGRPWDRAQFLALRESFREEWQPRGGIEDALIDAAALSFARYLERMNSYMIRTELQEERSRRSTAAIVAGRSSLATSPRGRKPPTWRNGSAGCSCEPCGR